MKKLPKLLALGLLCTFSSQLFSDSEPTFIVDAVGKILNHNDEIADNSRDNNIPMLYDKNQMHLMRKRDRAVRSRGGCYPPPDVIVGPEISVPAPMRYNYRSDSYQR